VATDGLDAGTPPAADPADRPAADRPAADPADRPAADRPAADRPAADPLAGRPVGFAHRGGPRWPLRENTLAAFRAALRVGVAGLESDVWLTADGIPVLHHDRDLRTRGRLRMISRMTSDELPRWLPSLEDLYAACGADFELSLDLKSPAAAPAVLAVARAQGGSAPRRLWLCGNLAEGRGWRRMDEQVRVVDSTNPRNIPGGAAGIPAHARKLRSAGIDALNMRHQEWTAGAVDAVHEAGRLAFGWAANTRSSLRRLITIGIDGMYSDRVDRMMSALLASGSPRR
jgi:glycerophosphoryl diester phosphodiesterase